MLSYFDKQKLFISCDPDFLHAFKFFKPDHANKFIPIWFKNLQKQFSMFDEKSQIHYPAPTIKSCPGIIRYLTNGIIIPLWTDLIIEIRNDGTFTYKASDDITLIESHEKDQYGYEFLRNFINLKLISPWYFKTNKSVEFIFTDPFYHLENSNEFKTLPGVQDWSYNRSSNINLMFPVKNETYQVNISCGTPMIHILNVNNKKLKLEYKLYDNHTVWQQESFMFQTSFLNRMNKQEKILEKQKSSCPFKNMFR